MTENNFTKGFQPAITQAYEALNSEYGSKNDPDYNKWLAAINDLVQAIKKDTSIKDTVAATMRIIEDDIIEFLHTNQEALRISFDNITGGHTHALGVLDTALTASPESLEKKPILEINLDRPKTLVITAEILQKIKDAISAFKVDTYEMIKADNAILRKKTPTRPAMLSLFISQFLNDLADGKDTSENISFAINWYLESNNTRGISLPEFDTMYKTLQCTNIEKIPFVLLFNKYVRPL